MKKAGVCGHFGIGRNLLNGQTVKTKTVTEELKNRLGETQVAVADSCEDGGRCFEAVQGLRKCNNDACKQGTAFFCAAVFDL